MKTKPMPFLKKVGDVTALGSVKSFEGLKSETVSEIHSRIEALSHLSSLIYD